MVEITCVLTAHMKPFLADALDAILRQTRINDLQVLVVDSGQWRGQTDPLSLTMGEIHDTYAMRHPLTWLFTNEPPDFKSVKCPVAYATNMVIREGYVKGRYMFTAYDDDRLYSTFVERMAGHLDDHPDDGAVYCSQDRIRLDPDGRESLIDVIRAIRPRQPGEWDCQVDGGQVMWRTELLDRFGPHVGEWLPEDPTDGSCRHSDGIFLERLASVIGGPVHGIPDSLCAHRFTPISAYTPSSRL